MSGIGIAISGGSNPAEITPERRQERIEEYRQSGIDVPIVSPFRAWCGRESTV